MASGRLDVVLIKPSKYDADGCLQRFRFGFMPNSTLLHLKGLTPGEVDGASVRTVLVDEYTERNLDYLELLKPERCDLLALVGVQSCQFQRALDLAALARRNGVRRCVIGGPHPMTCRTDEARGRGVSMAVSEAELIWPRILSEAVDGGDLDPVLGADQRWQKQLETPVLPAPERRQLRRYVIPMLGLYPSRGCPYTCNFCSVVKLAGRRVRGEAVETTIRSMRAAKRAGVRLIMFTSDNFNKYPSARELLEAIVEADVGLPFFVQCDTQLARDEGLVELLARAGCAQVFVGVESFDRSTLRSVRKFQNHPDRYQELVRLCHRHGVTAHFSNIIGFPDQGETEIRRHLEALLEIRPFMASFYILSPIPGTDQYEEFLDAGWIEADNLDAFDATELIWRHPRIGRDRMRGLLMDCYRRFYNLPDLRAKLLRRWNAPGVVNAMGLGYSFFARWAAWRGFHPMAGGFGRVRRDFDRDYLDLREARYGFRRLPLPRNLQLAAADRELYEIGGEDAGDPRKPPASEPVRAASSL